MKKILGLDLGTNSIGWSLVELHDNSDEGRILAMNSRIIPMGTDKIDYEKGVGISKAADRTMARTARKMNKRYKLRRNKLIYVLAQLDMLPTQLNIRGEFPAAEKIQQLNLLPIKRGTLQLNSVEQYKLRSDAATERIELKDLGKILYQLNQLRGYAGGGGNNESKEKIVESEENDDEGAPTKKQRTIILNKKVTVLSVTQLNETIKSKKKGEEDKEIFKYELQIQDESGETYTGTTILQDFKINDEKELEIKIEFPKSGKKTTFSLTKKSEWKKDMEDFEKGFLEKQTLGKRFYDELTLNKWYKIRNRVVLRHRYKEEFDAIWEEQVKHHAILANPPKDVVEKIANYIFPGHSPNQVKFREEAIKEGLRHIIKENIIYFQRELKPQTDLISGCTFEKELDASGKPLHRVLANSHPLFQENRIWEQLNRLTINTKKTELVKVRGKEKEKIYYYERPIPTDVKIDLYRKLLEKKQVAFSEVIKPLNLGNKVDYLNGLHSKAKLKGADTLISIKNCVGTENWTLLVGKNPEIATEIWDILYNKNGNEYDLNSVKVSALVILLNTYITDTKTAQTLALELAKKLEFPRRYGSLSKKAIEKILPLMRCGSYFDYEAIAQQAKDNLVKLKAVQEDGVIPEGEKYIEPYMVSYIANNPNAVREGGLQYTFASSLVYGKHTGDIIKPENAPIKNYHQIKYVADRNLRNPIVEQILNEALQVVKALWKQYGFKNDELEIRIELARELKNSAAEREKITKAIFKNEKINEGIKKRIQELKESVSPINIEKYKLWSNQSEEPYPFPKKTNEPTLAEIEKMRTWEEQKCVSPYTGAAIPLSKLFTKSYEVDHIIPKSRFFDDSMGNKVVCESEINGDKGNRTSWEYINNGSTKHKILNIDAFIAHVESHFGGAKAKRRNLLATKISEDFVTRQIKETQYISLAVKDELAKIVGTCNVKVSTGMITDYLRTQWGLKKLFMKVTESRYKQMELWDEGNSWIQNEFKKDENGKEKHVYQIKNWSKRHDHRHHALDALVVALTNPKHIQQLNELNKVFQDFLKDNKDRLKLNLDEGETELEAFIKLHEEGRDNVLQSMGSSRKFALPMSDLHDQVREHLESIVISHKSKDKLSVQKDKKGKPFIKTRGGLHEATGYGKLKDLNGEPTKIDIYKVPLSKLTDKIIEKIVSEPIKKELKEHRKKYSTVKDAFTGEGLVALNEKRFSSINAVKITYSKDENKESSLKQLYADNPTLSVKPGDNYLFYVMEKNDKRCFDIITFFDAAKIANQELKKGNNNFKQAIEAQMVKNNNANKTLFALKQTDLVYLPTDDNDPILNIKNNIDWQNYFQQHKKEIAKRVYKVVKMTKGECYFIENKIATPIFVKETKINEFGSNGNSCKFVTNYNYIKSLVDKTFKTELIKIQDSCIKLNIDWLGNIQPYWLK